MGISTPILALLRRTNTWTASQTFQGTAVAFTGTCRKSGLTNTGNGTANFGAYYENDKQIFAAKAWVKFNGTGTVAISDSENVTGITDNGTGDYTINITNAMANANYATVFGCRRLAAATLSGVLLKEGTTPTTSAFNIITTDGSGNNTDNAMVSAAVFGD